MKHTALASHLHSNRFAKRAFAAMAVIRQFLPVISLADVALFGFAGICLLSARGYMNPHIAHRAVWVVVGFPVLMAGIMLKWPPQWDHE